MQRKGATILISVMIICAIIMIVSMSMLATNISAAKNRNHYDQFIPMGINADGCAEEALLKLRRDSYYEGENMILDNSTCDILVTINGTERIIVIDVVNGDYIKKVQIDVTISPSFVITSWKEQVN